MNGLPVAPKSLVEHWLGQRSLNPARQAMLVVGGSLLVALLAQFSLPLPFTPVPVTGQTLGVLLVGGVLGANLGALSILLYLAEGAIGLPVFAGAAHGLPVGPTGGYLLGFVLMALVVGWLNERGWGRSWGRSWAAMAAGELVLFAIALPWLGLYVGFSHVLAFGLLPFIPGEAFKLSLAAMALPAAWRITG